MGILDYAGDFNIGVKTQSKYRKRYPGSESRFGARKNECCLVMHASMSF